MAGNGQENKDEFEGFKPSGRPVVDSGMTAPIPSGKKELPKIVIFDTIIDHMNGVTKKWGSGFPHKFHVIADTQGHKRYLIENAEQVMAVVSPDAIVDAIAKWIDAIKVPGVNLLLTDIRKCFDLWAARKHHFDFDIMPVLEKSKPGYCYQRLPFDAIEDPIGGECKFPLHKEVINRMSNANAFCSSIGSLFDPKADRQQYVWLYGEGNNGKSTLAGILCRAFGLAAKVEYPPESGNRFWTHGLIGKRLIVFPDCNNYSFVTSGLFKSLTGGDLVRVEEKGESSFSATLICKFIFFSNEKPNISSSKADTRRAIYCELGPISQHFGNDYAERLWEEFPYFLHYCKTCYAIDMEKGRQIVVDQSVVEELVTNNEEDKQVLFDRYFELSPDSYVLPITLHDVLKDYGISNKHEVRSFLKWLETRHGVEKKCLRIAGEPKRVYFGLREKTSQEMRDVQSVASCS